MRTLRAAGPINGHEYEVTTVQDGVRPRYKYTTGLLQDIGSELILAGAYLFSGDQCDMIVDGVARTLFQYPEQERFAFQPSLSFVLTDVDPRWVGVLMDGESPLMRQIVPQGEEKTLDVPDLSALASVREEQRPPSAALRDRRAWYVSNVEVSSFNPQFAAVSTSVLMGDSVFEVSRWEDDHWEVWSSYGPEENHDYIKVVPLRLIAAIEPSLPPLNKLSVGHTVRRCVGEDRWNIVQQPKQQPERG